MKTQNITPLGIFLRLLAAICLTVLAVFAPAIFSVIGSLRPLFQGELFGGGNAGMLAAAIAAIAIYAISSCVAYFGARFLITRWDRLPVASLGMRIEKRGLIWCAAMVVIAFIIQVIVSWVVVAVGVQDNEVAVRGDTWWLSILLTFGLGVFYQGIPEEIVWRGWLISSLRNPWHGLFWSTLIFTVLHLFSNGGQENLVERFIYLAIPLGFAFTAGVTRLITNSTWPAIGVHAGFHLSGLIGLYMPILESPVHWLLCGTAWVMVGLVIAWRWKLFTVNPQQAVLAQTQGVPSQ
ncbi:CPBP family intramembrane glutamic endopeptidase [Corynebacterium freiburgense]|uniref:CPBP family intramembrane glutamic endopeptidase n=1 Tax=Corynebacterium freiburgense TaxID=556548 RepID=UPI0006842293|nr:CPBP family intramembrane glutamic endopeptidase [Corynebacterium freiburgense]WJZ02145.1 CAAX amino terminal protease self- immunity [Corynebacterium freiburgense]